MELGARRSLLPTSTLVCANERRLQNLRRCRTARDAQDGAGKLTDYPTVQEAVMAWHRLRPEQTKRATIKVFGGPVYTASEIVRLHFGPKPQ
jgi:hypothetical protein